MPITTRTVLTCGHCGADKAQANGWYLLGSMANSLNIEHASGASVESYVDDPDWDAACGRECLLKMVSKTLGELTHA